MPKPRAKPKPPQPIDASTLTTDDLIDLIRVYTQQHQPFETFCWDHRLRAPDVLTHPLFAISAYTFTRRTLSLAIPVAAHALLTMCAAADPSVAMPAVRLALATEVDVPPPDPTELITAMMKCATPHESRTLCTLISRINVALLAGPKPNPAEPTPTNPQEATPR